ncbi:MAG: hypothetical protein E6554_18000 [Bacteroides sp.]|nr:hypothetical protein [Bacteroides sp.]
MNMPVFCFSCSNECRQFPPQLKEANDRFKVNRKDWQPLSPYKRD